jgi:hypothetical protein
LLGAKTLIFVSGLDTFMSSGMPLQGRGPKARGRELRLGYLPISEGATRFLRFLIAAEDFFLDEVISRHAGRQQKEINRLSQGEPEGRRIGRSIGSVLSLSLTSLCSVNSIRRSGDSYGGSTGKLTKPTAHSHFP